MLVFVKNAYRKYIGLILWITIFIWIIIGGTTGYILMNMYKGNIIFIILGIVGGFIIGIIVNIIFGGFIATILNIDRNLEELNGKKYIIENMWVCTKCGEWNKNNVMYCQKCSKKQD